jgi:3-hydroxybutyryl-CoA dehydratase
MEFVMKEYTIGQQGGFSKTISESDVYLFAGITGDFNSMHINEEYASQSPFGGRIAHGMLSGSMISTVLGAHFPGPGTIYLQQSLKFVAPVRIGDTVTAQVTLAELLPKNKARLTTQCFNQKGELVVDGEAVVLLPRD